jgi:hypothetical protein
VVTGTETHDGRLEDHRGGDEFAHVPLYCLAGHPVGRRQHLETEDVAVPASRGDYVRDAHADVGESGQHSTQSPTSAVMVPSAAARWSTS